MKRIISPDKMVKIISHASLVLCLMVGIGFVFGQNDVSEVITIKKGDDYHFVALINDQGKEAVQGGAPPYTHMYLESIEVPVPEQFDLHAPMYVSLSLHGNNIHKAERVYRRNFTEIISQYMSIIHKPLDDFHEMPSEAHTWKSNVLLMRGGAVRIKCDFEFKISDQAYISLAFDSLQIHFFQPDPNFVSSPPVAWAMKDECGCPLPQHVTRTGWGCPVGQNPSCSNPVTTQVTHLIVHHSATPNNSANWANTVRSIWNFHTGNNGWCDIGYNWLIDPNGVIYEGRGGGDNIRGAHFCGTNTSTMGICLLGDYQVDTPTDAALRSLERLLAWKSCKENLGVKDTTLHSASSLQLPVITGHRLGCGTTCPGQQVYNRLTTIRQGTADTLALCPIISSNDQDVEINLNIFPNPTNDAFTIEYPKPISRISLLDQTGKFIQSFNPLKRSFSIKGLSKGLYIIECWSGSISSKRKLLVQ